MPQDDLIARRYARGLAELAGERNDVDQVRADVKFVSDLLDPMAGERHSPELLDFLISPVVTPENKLAAAKRIMEQSGVCEPVANLLGVLVERGRVELMPNVARAFADLAGSMTGEYTALVQTARPLSEEQSRRLSDALSAAFGGVVRLHQQIEPGLLAGARVTVGDKTFDGSVLGRLDGLRQQLTATGWNAVTVDQPEVS